MASYAEMQEIFDDITKDFQAFSKQTGNELLSHAAEGKEFTFFMKRK